MDEQGMTPAERVDATIALAELELAEQGDLCAELVRRRNRLELARDRGDSRPGLEAVTARVQAAFRYRRELLAELAALYAELAELEAVAA